MLADIFWTLLQLIGIFVLLCVGLVILILGIAVIVLFIKGAIKACKKSANKKQPITNMKDISKPGIYVFKNGEFIKLEEGGNDHELN